MNVKFPQAREVVTQLIDRQFNDRLSSTVTSTDGGTNPSSMSAATPTLIPRGGHFPALLPPVPSRGEPRPPTFRGRSDGRINTVRDLAREMEDLSDEEAEVEGLVSKNANDPLVTCKEPTFSSI